MHVEHSYDSMTLHTLTSNDHALVSHINSVGTWLPNASARAILHRGCVRLDVAEVSSLREMSLPMEVPLRCANSGSHCLACIWR